MNRNLKRRRKTKLKKPGNLMIRFEHLNIRLANDKEIVIVFITFKNITFKPGDRSILSYFIISDTLSNEIAWMF